MQLAIKKIEALVLSISVQSGVGIIETISDKDETTKATFKITGQTPLLTKDGHRIGVSAIPVKGRIVAFVDSSKPIPMQTPPQIEPLAIILNQFDKMGDVAIGQFDEALFSESLNLKLHVGEKTEIINLQGQRVEENGLANHVLIVFYDKQTRSRPAQVSATKIIVLNHLQA